MVSPGLLLIVGALFVPVLPRTVRRAWVPILGVLVLLALANLQDGQRWTVTFWGQDLVLLEVTWLRMVFGWAFGLAIVLWGIYAWSESDRAERTAGLLYAGCSLGVVFAGSWLAFFLFWEGMALTSTVVVLCGRHPRAYRAALRYLLVHLLGGVMLACGIGLQGAQIGVGEAHLVAPMALDGLGAWLIFLGFAVNAAVWPIAAWLPDTYPEGSPTGTVLLGTFTTKTAAFAMTFVFAGESVLCLLGALMAIYGATYALSTRNYRRLLSYSLVGQVGFMLCSAGVGGEIGQSGAAAHALMHVLYKSLLFMSAGAVLLRTREPEGGGFGGLWRQMPYTAVFALVGAAAISAVPLTNGYASKSIILDALHGSTGARAHLAEVVLYVVSAAAPLYVGLRYPWLAFSGRDRGVQVERAPFSMRVGMGLTALLCLVLGVAPGLWMKFLPGTEHVHVFTWGHVGKQFLLLAAGTGAFLLWRAAARYARRPAFEALPDTDRIWRRAAKSLVATAEGPLLHLFTKVSEKVHGALPRAFSYASRNPAGFVRLGLERVRLGFTGLLGSAGAIDRAQARFQRERTHYHEGRAAETWPIGRTVLYVTLLLAIYLVIWLVR